MSLEQLRAERVFAGAGLSVIAWFGDKGASHFSTTDKLVKRSAYASSSMVIRGAFRMTHAPGDPSAWPLVRPGDMCNAVLPDFVPGSYVWSAMEDGSLEFCCGTINETGGADFGKFDYEPRSPGVCVVPRGSVLIVATGQVVVNGETLEAPRVVHAKTRYIEAQMAGRGMWMARP